MPRCPGCSVSGHSSVTLQSVSSGHSVLVSFSACRKGPRFCYWSRWCLRFYGARPFYLCLVRHSQDYLCPVSSVANVESNEIRLENIDISGHILPALFSIRFTLVSHYSAFSSVRRTDVNVLNSLKYSRLSCKWRSMQNNCDTRMRRMENNVGRVWHDMSLFSISISIALLSSYIRESGNGALMVKTIFSIFPAFKHLTTVNLQHICVIINKGNSYFTFRLYGRL